MRLNQHIIASGAVSLGIFGITRSVLIGVTSFLAGFLIDIDHLFDYWRQHPGKFDMEHFFSTCEGYKLAKVYLLMHSVEFVIAAGIIAYYTRSAVMLGCLAGFGQHLIFDQVCNKTHPLTYFLFFRLSKGFNGEEVFDIPGE